MIPLTMAENQQALDSMIAGERIQLAQTRWRIQLHRDVLNSPAEAVAALEAQAMKSAQAIEWMQAQRDSLHDVAGI